MWHDDIYYYSRGMLKAIAQNYERLYTDGHHKELFAIAEAKADFDRALDTIGRGEWRGIQGKFSYYRPFGRRQRIIIASILDISDRQLKVWGFPDPKTLRSRAYQDMLAVLNVGKRNFRQSATSNGTQS
jgi:hypothetical protein